MGRPPRELQFRENRTDRPPAGRRGSADHCSISSLGGGGWSAALRCNDGGYCACATGIALVHTRVRLIDVSALIVAHTDESAAGVPATRMPPDENYATVVIALRGALLRDLAVPRFFPTRNIPHASSVARHRESASFQSFTAGLLRDLGFSYFKFRLLTVNRLPIKNV